MTEALEPAFPRDHRYQGHNGMSLRDYFAGQVLSGSCTHTGGWDSFKNIATEAYQLADAMLAARKEQHATA